jgi:hypothetical protein
MFRSAMSSIAVAYHDHNITLQLEDLSIASYYQDNRSAAIPILQRHSSGSSQQVLDWNEETEPNKANDNKSSWMIQLLLELYLCR